MALCSCSDTVRPSAGCPDVRSTSRGQSQQVSGHRLCAGSRAPRTGTTGPSLRLGPTARRCPFSVEILRGPQSRAVAREPRAPAHQCHRGVHRQDGRRACRPHTALPVTVTGKNRRQGEALSQTSRPLASRCRTS